MPQLVPIDASLLTKKTAPAKGTVDRLVMLQAGGMDSLQEETLKILEIHLPKPQPWNPKMKTPPNIDRITPTVKVVLTDNDAGNAIAKDGFLELGEAIGEDWEMKYFQGRVTDVTKVNGKIYLTVTGLYKRGAFDG